MFTAVTWRMRVWFTVSDRRHWMPLPVPFVLIGIFLWVAENVATYFGAWEYPDQEGVWRMVHLGESSSWILLVSLSFVLVSALMRHRTSRDSSLTGPTVAH